MIIVDRLTNPKLVAAARDYFNEQTKNNKYVPFIRSDDPHVELNTAIMDNFNPQLAKFYYDAVKSYVTRSARHQISNAAHDHRCRRVCGIG